MYNKYNMDINDRILLLILHTTINDWILLLILM